MDFTGLKKIAEATRIPITVYRDGERVFQFPDEGLFESSFDREPASLKQLAGVLIAEEKPVLFFENRLIYYGAFLMGTHLVLLGPAAQDTVTPAARRAFRSKHALEKEPLLPRISGRRLTSTLSLVYYAFTGEDVDPYLIQIVNILETAVAWNIEAATEDYELEISDNERDHNSGDFEQKLMRMVREGDVEAMDHFLHSEVALGAEHMGVLAQDETKHVEYMCVAMLTLLARVAAQGGMSAEKAYSLADIYMQKLALCKSPDEMLALTGRAQYEFTAEVKEARENTSNLHFVEAAKNYIAANLRRPFQISEIAPAIGVSRTYLTRRFSEAEGMTIQQYVTRERCKHAAKMLQNFDYPIAMIAEFFCFSTQSHFGKVFKEYSGMTPKEYRNRYKKQ